ncbi:nucleoside-diphosphate-sugar epimerase [Fusarium albosuccineum]|uniref:Nucleoside-diphosphate-sugar epimerase n=1 Tax=Fusarium albosuccineum TaxID=1237068 RepID=A0A8H4P6S1_9HYPO|nr:nucleoside-diphosphate-sugar epimerase [Fusarium albosuccineum]
MHIILTGATGLVGSGVLDAMLKAKDITKISIISRRPVQMAIDTNDPRVNVIIHKDFNSYEPETLSQLAGARGCVWALGISQSKVGKEDYVRITKDYALEAAKAFSTLPKDGEEPFRFIYVSGEGATQKPGMFSPIFARVKGETETALGEMSSNIPTLKADSVRPAFVDAAGHEAIQKYLPDPGLAIRTTLTVLGPPLRAFYKSGHSPTPMLGDFLTRMAMGKVDSQIEGPGAFRLGGSWVVENVGLRRVMGL